MVVCACVCMKRRGRQIIVAIMLSWDERHGKNKMEVLKKHCGYGGATGEQGWVEVKQGEDGCWEESQ